MQTLEEIKEQLKDRNLTAVAKGAGVSRNSLYKLVNGSTNPSYETVQKLVAYLRGEETK